MGGVRQTYFVTGATGFIGGVLARQLVEAGHTVHALVRTAAKADALRALGARLYDGDITAPDTLAPGMRGVDGVFHVAAWYTLGTPGRAVARRVNVDGTRHVLEAMRALSIPKGVYTSTIAVNSDTRGQVVDESYRYDGPFISEYERTKWAAHYEVAVPMQRAGLPLVIVQPCIVYGPGDTSSVRAGLGVDAPQPRGPRRSGGTGEPVDSQGRLHQHDRGELGHARPGRRRIVPARRTVPQRVRADQVGGALRGGGPTAACGPAARHRAAVHRLRAG
jgi:nucleoside-diphosphate-sugar epimerase